jgi:hypothetical protein
VRRQIFKKVKRFRWKRTLKLADGDIETEWEKNYGDEEDTWAQDGADGAQNCPQVGTRYSQDWAEGGTRYPQDWTEGGTRCPQNGAEDGTCCPQNGTEDGTCCPQVGAYVAKVNLGQKEAKQQELSEEQMSGLVRPGAVQIPDGIGPPSLPGTRLARHSFSC